MKLRDDIDPAKTWIISDTHFGHRNIAAYCHRPENFEDILLERINDAVRPGDTLLHLGDLCYRGNAWFKNMIAPKIAPQAARKLLILGNHDRQRHAFYKQTGWKLARPFYIDYGGSYYNSVLGTSVPLHMVEFDHYQSREDLGGFVWRVHGHIHNNGYYDGRSNPSVPDFSLVPYLRNHINVSCEMTKYKPVRMDLLLDAAIFGRLPAGGSVESADGDAPSGSDIDKPNAHVAYSRRKVG
jgi:calcineurin-like phosphoesterase family protein